MFRFVNLLEVDALWRRSIYNGESVYVGIVAQIVDERRGVPASSFENNKFSITVEKIRFGKKVFL
jgi:hypothetical protein